MMKLRFFIMKPRCLGMSILAVLTAFAILAAPLRAQDAPSIATRWWSVTHTHIHGSWGIVVADHTGTVLWQINQDSLMTPASTVKALTTGFVRASLGTKSITLDSTIRQINIHSINYGAEKLLLWGGGRTDAGKQLTEYVQGVTGLQSVYLVDGSGLSHENKVAPVVFTTYLARILQLPEGLHFPYLLPSNGMGTLKPLRIPAADVIQGKTGTLDGVSTLIGYINRPQDTLIVSIMYNGKSRSAAKLAEWDLFRQLSLYSATPTTKQIKKRKHNVHRAS